MSIVFFQYPDLDIYVSSLFYNIDSGFIFSNNFLALFLFKTLPTFTIIFAIILILRVIIGYCFKKDNKAKILLYCTILVSLAVGPGIIVNSVLKENFGRARPKQIVEFGAKKNFSKVYVYSDQCKKNCSFSSGHAAAAFGFTSIALLVSPQYQLLAYFLGLFYGCLVGAGRIIQGGHFISDILASGWIVLLTNAIFIYLYQTYLKFLYKNQDE